MPGGKSRDLLAGALTRLEMVARTEGEQAAQASACKTSLAGCETSHEHANAQNGRIRHEEP